MSETTNMGGAGKVETLRARLAEVEREHKEALWRFYAAACPGWATDGDIEHMIANAERFNAQADINIARECARAEKAEADLAAEREARQRAEAKVAGLAAALLTERGEHHDRLCAWVLSEGACDCHYGRIDAALADAAPVLRAHIERETAALRESMRIANLNANTATEAMGRLREERNRLAAALAELNRAAEAALSVDAGLDYAIERSDAALAGSDRALRDIKAQARREALEAAVAAVVEASIAVVSEKLRADPDESEVLTALMHEEAALSDAQNRIRALFDAPEKEAEPYTCDSRGAEASGCNDPYGRCTLCQRNREADRE